MTDITAFMDFFIDSFISMLTTIFNHLSNIHFFGISLLSYIIALFVLSVVVPLIIAIVNTSNTTTVNSGTRMASHFYDSASAKHALNKKRRAEQREINDAVERALNRE